MPTKTEIIKQTREIIEECYNEPTSIFPEHKHFAYLAALCRNHPSADDPEHSWRYVNIDEFMVTDGVNNKGRSLYTVHNGETNIISWNKCCGLKQNPLTDVLRDIVREDTIQFKKESDLYCRECGVKDLPYRRFHVDHIYPFSKIRDEFFLKRQKPTKFGSVHPIGYCLLPADKKLGEDWYTHHKERATYQILCDKCNMSKGAKVSVSLPI